MPFTRTQLIAGGSSLAVFGPALLTSLSASFDKIPR